MVSALCDSALTLSAFARENSRGNLPAQGFCAAAGGFRVRRRRRGGVDALRRRPRAGTTPTETDPHGGRDRAGATGDGAPPAETSPEAMPGGAGDEEPARTLALFTGRDGRITPRVVRVPAFIAVQIELRSGDGATYALRFGDTTLTAGGQLNSVSTTIDGLRPSESSSGRRRGPATGCASRRPPSRGPSDGDPAGASHRRRRDRAHLQRRSPRAHVDVRHTRA